MDELQEQIKVQEKKYRQDQEEFKQTKEAALNHLNSLLEQARRREKDLESQLHTQPPVRYLRSPSKKRNGKKTASASSASECGAPTQSGEPCKRKTSSPPCWQHE